MIVKAAPRLIRWTTQHDHLQRCLKADSEGELLSWGYVPKGNPSTKLCHWCKSDGLALISTQDLKLCVDCGHQMKWKLSDGQKSTFD